MSAPFRLSRRAVLRGAGSVAVALPWLEIMTPERSSQAAPEPAKRFLAVYQPGGSVLESWRPTGTETDFELGGILAPFEPVKSSIVVLDGIDMKSAVGEQDQSGMVAWLSGTEQGTSALAYAKGPSIDQVIATRTAGSRAFPSLYFSVRWGTGKARGQVHPIDITSFDDTSAASPRRPLLDPQRIWSDLFGSIDPGDDGAWDRSVLDSVQGRYRALAARLGASDRQRLEQHLDKVRELEQSLGTIRRCSAPALVDTTGYDPASGLGSADDGSIRDLPTDEMIPTVGKLMMDMMVMAFACDLTTSGVLQWTDCEAKHTLPWLALTDHHRFYMSDGGFRSAECVRISTWYSEQHAYLVQALAAVDMGGHSLLDESVVFFGSNIQHPANHTKTDMPFVLAGNGGGLRTGRYVRYAHTSHNDLLVRLLNLFGDPRTTFGTAAWCTGPLAL